jgi:hypothetical protein
VFRKRVVRQVARSERRSASGISRKQDVNTLPTSRQRNDSDYLKPDFADLYLGLDHGRI